jgi:hypothetical protein
MKNLTVTICLTIAVLLEFSLPVFAGGNRNFRPINCEYTVRFPTAPKITQVYTQQFGNIPTANGGIKNSLLRAECLMIDNSRLNKKIIKEWLISAASKMGLSGLSYTFKRETYGSVAQIRGYKTISNSPATYEIQMYVGVNSILIIYVGSLSSVYPTNEIHEFISSVRR